MELPHLGTHCSEDNCRRLDFLPVKCDGCSKVFCGDHYSYTGHNCPVAYKKNVQVPVCPLCNAPVPGNLNELPDIRVSQHIDNDCKSDAAIGRRQKVYTNRCTFKTCKKKEMIPILCDTCNLNFCLKHRHPQDHECTKNCGKSLGKAGQAALARTAAASSSSSRNQQSIVTRVSNATSSAANGLSRAMGFRPAAVQGNLSDEEAFQLALQASLNPNATVLPVPNHTITQEQEDFLLAKAIAESEAGVVGDVSATNRGRRSQPNCEIS
ncbi:AN1-type zinc finger protein 2A [Folsomia candida]|uniref:AN1-type zinc finger protein 2B n=1 Tax=Folsomia candida TaxID=158441 RepID=A0A226ENP6_FOLCA|nr:AN1-type zinc finger protein 2A [Folsomia candida]OXA58747.1 AN1-type zinc finger protein 2B [Folsomia candida]